MRNGFYRKMIKILKKNKIFWSLLVFIFILHMITYPSIHTIGDEEVYLEISKKFCELDFSYFFGESGKPAHQPFYYVILCITSPIHNFVLGNAEIITYIFFIFLVVGWYLSVPNSWKINKKGFVLLLFSNSLLWVYSLRVLLDVPLAFFLSLGIFHFYLFFEKGKKKNYYLGLLLLSLALLIKESALAFLPIFFVYLLLKKDLNLKKLFLLVIPCIPWLILTMFQYFSGFPVFWAFSVAFKPTTTIVWQQDVPYAQLPTILFMLGIFGPGIISCILMWKNTLMKKDRVIKGFFLFSLVLYLLWEISYDFLLYGNMPRYHTTLMPFLALIITAAANKSKKLRYIYYLTLVYSLIVGFIVAYYFHTHTQAIWKVPIKELIYMFLK